VGVTVALRQKEKLRARWVRVSLVELEKKVKDRGVSDGSVDKIFGGGSAAMGRFCDVVGLAVTYIGWQSLDPPSIRGYFEQLGLVGGSSRWVKWGSEKDAQKIGMDLLKGGNLL